MCARRALLIIFNITKLHISGWCFHFTSTEIKTKRFHLARSFWVMAHQDTNVSHCKAHVIRSNRRGKNRFEAVSVSVSCSVWVAACLYVCVCTVCSTALAFCAFNRRHCSTTTVPLIAPYDLYLRKWKSSSYIPFRLLPMPINTQSIGSAQDEP